MKGKKGGGKYTNHNKNPKRGPPGILVFCEAGREKKCIHEGMEILNHYYYNSNDHYESDNDEKDCNKREKNSNSNGDDNHNDGKGMTLEEEIQMMKTEQKKAPFHIYETGCRGSVFFMCSAKHCNVLVQKQNHKHQHQDQKEQEKEQQTTNGNKDTTLKEENHDDSKKNSKRKLDIGENPSISSSTTSDVAPKKQKVEEDENNNNNINTNSAKFMTHQSKNLWDPIQTVQSIVRDIRNNDSVAPRSRFITKMIPIQATCFANVEEITTTSKALLQKYLIPHGIQFSKEHTNAKTCEEKEEKKKNSTQQDENVTKVNLPTFKIEFRKRFCSHLKRDEVINIVADSVEDLSNEYWNELEKEQNSASDCPQIEKSKIATATIETTTDTATNETTNTTATATAAKITEENEEIGKQSKENSIGNDGNENATKKRKYPQLFNVDLSNPTYTIIIEICKTLCTMSVMKDAQSYYQFNLMKIQENALNLK